MRAVALLISLALIHVSFGPQAWAQLVAPVTGVSTPLGGNVSAAAGASTNHQTSGSQTNPSIGLTLSGINTQAAPSAVSPSIFSEANALQAVPTAASISQDTKGGEDATPASAPDSGLAPAAEAKASVETSIVTGPKTVSVGRKIATRFAELKKFLGFKTAPPLESGPGALNDSPAIASDQAASSASGNGLTPATSEGQSSANGDRAPPTPPTPPAPQTPEKGGTSKGPWLGLGLAGVSIIGYRLAMQIGLEAQGVAMPQLTENAFKDFTLLPLVAIFASIGSMIGQPMTRFFAERLGLSKTFYAAHALRAISLGAMVLLFGTGMMSMPLMMGFYLVNGVVTGIASTAEDTLRKLILAEKGVSQETYRTWWQLLVESLAVPAPMIFGSLVHSLGAVGAPLVTAVYPVTILLGLIIAYILKVYPLKDVKKASEAAAKDAPVAKTKSGAWQSVKNTVAKIFTNMEEGKNYVMNIAYLKYALAAAAVFDLFNIVIYRLLAPGYGKMTGGEAGLSAIQGNIVGMYSLGGLILAIIFLALKEIAKSRAKKNPVSSKEAAATERSSMLRWAMAGIPALALLAAMAFQIALPFAPLVYFGTNWMPSSALAAALIPFGVFQVAASIKLNSYFQEKVPNDADKAQKAFAFAGSVATALSIVAMLTLRPLFSAVGVFNPFPWVAGALIPIAAGLFFLHRKLAGATTPEAVAAADEAQRQREGGQGEAVTSRAYVGLILGIVTAAVVITALPMIPGIAGFMAGMGVLAKFSVNLGLTLVIPLAGYLIGRSRGRSTGTPGTPPTKGIGKFRTATAAAGIVGLLMAMADRLNFINDPRLAVLSIALMAVAWLTEAVHLIRSSKKSRKT